MAKPRVLENLKRSWERSWKVMKFEELKGVRSLIDKLNKHLTHFSYDYFKRKLISRISWEYIYKLSLIHFSGSLLLIILLEL